MPGWMPYAAPAVAVILIAIIIRVFHTRSRSNSIPRLITREEERAAKRRNAEAITRMHRGRKR